MDIPGEFTDRLDTHRHIIIIKLVKWMLHNKGPLINCRSSKWTWRWTTGEKTKSDTPWAAVYIIVACLMIWGWPWAKLKSPVHRVCRDQTTHYRLIIKWCGCDQQTPSNLIITIRNDKRLSCGTWWKNTDAQSGARVFCFFPLTCSVAPQWPINSHEVQNDDWSVWYL